MVLVGMDARRRTVGRRAGGGARDPRRSPRTGRGSARTSSDRARLSRRRSRHRRRVHRCRGPDRRVRLHLRSDRLRAVGVRLGQAPCLARSRGKRARPLPVGGGRTRRCGARDGRSVNPATCRLSCTTDSAGTSRRWSAPVPRASTMSSASAVSPSWNSSRLRSRGAAPDDRRRGAVGSRGTNAAGGHGLGTWHPGSLTRPARLRRRRRRALPRGDRAARANPDRRPSRPRPPGVRRVAAAREPPARRP